MNNDMTDIELDPYNFRKCTNPLCDRLAKKGIAFCCPLCATAHEQAQKGNVYDPEHTEKCNARHAELNGPLPSRKWYWK